MDADQELCQRSYAESALFNQERRIIKSLFDQYIASDAHSTSKFLPEEVRFTGPTVRRAYFEKVFADIILDIGGQTIPRHTVRADRPGIATSHYSLYRLGVFGITISHVWDEKHLPRVTDFRSSLIDGIEIPFDFATEAAVEDSYIYTLFQHGKGDIDSAIPHYASFKAFDRRNGIVWKRPLFKYHASYVNEIIDAITPVRQSESDEIVRLKEHLRRLETGEQDE